MSFLAPLFLLGALAVAAPVIFHLIRRTTRERTPFSSLLFLQPDPPRLTQRSRVEHWLLLLLRAAALVLLALAFARPFFRAPASQRNADGATKRSVLLVDVSASLRRAGLREASLAKAESVLAKAGPADSVAVLVFADGVRTLMDFSQWSAVPPESRVAQAMARLRETELTWEGTNLAEALSGAADLLRESASRIPGGDERTPEGGEITVVTDLQEGSRLTGLQGRGWLPSTTLTLSTLTPQNPGNAGIALAAEGPPPAGGGIPPARVRVYSAADTESTQFQVGWASGDGLQFEGKPLEVYVPPGQARVVSLPWPEQTSGAGRILLKGDAESFDNLIQAVPPVAAKVTAFYLGSEGADDSKQPLFFLNRALPQSRQVTLELVPLPPAAVLPEVEQGKSAVYFVGGVPAGSQLEPLKTRLAEGGLVVMVLTSAQQAPALAALAGVELEKLKLEEATRNQYAMLEGIDFRHPLFAPFADPRFSDFTKIRFWHHRRLDAEALPGSRVLAKFDSGNPAILELPVGKGRLVVLTSGWHPADSQLALSSKFVPLIASLLESGGVVRTPPAWFTAGATLTREDLGFPGGAPVSLTLPGEKSVVLGTGTPVFTQTELPGLYTASAAGKTLAFAVNPDPVESKTAPLPVEELEKLGVPVAGAAATLKTAARELTADPGAVETEGRQKLWRWIIAGALCVLIAETLLAGLTARRATVPGGTAV